MWDKLFIGSSLVVFVGNVIAEVLVVTLTAVVTVPTRVRHNNKYNNIKGKNSFKKGTQKKIIKKYLE